MSTICIVYRPRSRARSEIPFTLIGLVALSLDNQEERALGLGPVDVGKVFHIGARLDNVRIRLEVHEHPGEVGLTLFEFHGADGLHMVAGSLQVAERCSAIAPVLLTKI